MNILVVGGTGFTGSYVVPVLLKKELHVKCLIRASSDKNVLPHSQIEWAYGDLDDKGSLQRALHGVEVLINVASLGFGHAPNIIQACVDADVQRTIFCSTTAIFTKLSATSRSVRLEAEEAIRRSGLAYTILRPTMIYGSSRDRNMCRLIRYLQRWPVIPVVGDGEKLQQPVYVEDVAKAIVKVTFSERTVGKAYNIAGATALTFNQVIDMICVLLARKVRKIQIPAAPVIMGLRMAESLGLCLPIKAEQIQRLNEHKTFDFHEATRDFGYDPRPFEEGIRLEIQEMASSV